MRLLKNASHVLQTKILHVHFIFAGLYESWEPAPTCLRQAEIKKKMTIKSAAKNKAVRST